MENDTLIIHFQSDEILKLDRTVRCTPPYSDGCRYFCTELGYGNTGQISVEIKYPNGDTEDCLIDYRIRMSSEIFIYSRFIYLF